LEVSYNASVVFGEEFTNMVLKRAFLGIIAAGCVAGMSTLLSHPGYAQDVEAKVKTSMGALKSKAAKVGAAKIEGTDAVGGKAAPAIYFGSTKINNNFDLVDEVVKENGGTATIFVKAGDEFVRVSTNVKKDDGSRAIGTILDPKGKAIVAIQKGEPFYGDVTILEKPYTTGYEPIRDAANNVIGIYYVGYMK
jgi:hypothetical protein